ncbi:MAG: phosphoribosyltransferase [Candidatus Omnitrophota bacterium]
MKEISFQTIINAIDSFELPDFNYVVGIAEGGTVVSALLARKLKCDMSIVKFNYRDEQNCPKTEYPVLSGRVNFPADCSRILLADDVSVSGKTLKAARGLFSSFQVFTFVLCGKADYVLFPGIKECVKWPWKILNDHKAQGVL